MRRAAIRRKPKPRRDPVTPAVYRAVRLRDGSCVGPRLRVRLVAKPRGMDDLEAIANPARREIVAFPGDCFGPVELDHVHGSGLGKRGPSTLDNLVSLCSLHHRWKTENGRVARMLLDAYIAAMRDRRASAEGHGVESPASTVPPEEPDAGRAV